MRGSGTLIAEAVDVGRLHEDEPGHGLTVPTAYT